MRLQDLKLQVSGLFPGVLVLVLKISEVAM